MINSKILFDYLLFVVVVVIQLALNRGSVTDTEMTDIINTITDGLFSVFVSLGKNFVSIRKFN